MYLEIDEGYFEHPKTLDLCSRLQDSKACVYPLRLWKWACRSAKSGKLGKISAFAIEKAMDYDPKDGKCFYAMCLAGFIDTMPDGTFEIHDWMNYTGGAIARMDAKVKANKDRREAARAARDAGTMPELCRHDSGQTRQDKTSPDKTSQDPEKTSCAETPTASSPPVDPPVLTFPCDGEPKCWHLTKAQVEHWRELFPSRDILSDCRAALAWIEAKPDRRKTAKGMPACLVGWFGRAQNRGPSQAQQSFKAAPGRQANYGRP